MTPTNKPTDMIKIEGMMLEDIIVTEDGTEVITNIIVVFLTINNIAIGEDGMIGIVNTATIHKNIGEDIITMTTEEISCLPTVKMTELVPLVSRSEFISKVPCHKCLIFVMCKQRMRTSVVNFAHSKYGCEEARKYVMASTQNEINKMRVLFGLQEYP